MTAHVLLRVIAFDADDPTLLHGILIERRGLDRRPADATCCGVWIYPQRRPVVRDGEPITCERCLRSLGRIAFRELERV